MTFPHTVQAADALPAPEQISQQVHDVVLSGDGQLRGHNELKRKCISPMYFADGIGKHYETIASKSVTK